MALPLFPSVTTLNDTSVNINFFRRSFSLMERIFSFNILKLRFPRRVVKSTLIPIRPSLMMISFSTIPFSILSTLNFAKPLELRHRNLNALTETNQGDFYGYILQIKSPNQAPPWNRFVMTSKHSALITFMEAWRNMQDDAKQMSRG